MLRSIEDIRSMFDREFGAIRDKFRLHELSMAQIPAKPPAALKQGGVYVWWKDGEVLKVGRSLTNTLRRGLDHKFANTGGRLAALAEDPSTKLLLFNVPDSEDLHWAFALEDYFERALSPAIPSDRRG